MATTNTTANTNTTPGSSQFAPQASNVFFGYEWAAPLVTTTGAWYPVESVIIQPSSSLSGQALSQSDSYNPGSTHESLPLNQTHHREPRVYGNEEKLTAPFRDQFVTHPYPSPYIQSMSRMAMPNRHPEPLVPLLHAHRGGASYFTNYDELSQVESAINSDPSIAFDEPPPPYPNNALLVHPLNDVFSHSAVLPAERLFNVGHITPSPLAPVPLRHSSLYQVLKHESPGSPALGTLQSRASTLAHALEPQEPQVRQAPSLRTSALGGGRAPVIGASESPMSAMSSGCQMASTSFALVLAEPTLPRIPALPVTSAQVDTPVSSATPPCVMVPAHNLSVVTPLQAHTLAHVLPEMAPHDYDMLPRLRKLQPALSGSAKEDQSTASSPLSSLSSRPSSSTGLPTVSMSDSKSTLESAFTLPLLGRKRPVLRAKLACLFCRRRKIQCRPLRGGDHQDNTCQQCAKRCRQCEYPEMTWRGRGRKRSRVEAEESDYEEDSSPSTKIKLEA